jgi:sugar phosphate isomerase/epimerase
MYYSGIGDEAAREPEKQVKAHRDLGWKHIEMRTVRGVNVTDLPDRDFAAMEEVLGRSGLQVSCFASQLGNWARPINAQFERDTAELRRAVPRMRRLGASFIRCMSYPNADPPWSEAEWRRESIRRMRELARIAEGEGVTLVHENCSGWGGLKPRSTLDLLAAVDCPALRLVFDTGNPFQYGLDSLDFYRQVREHIVYVHIKDYLPPTRKGEEQASFPGEGVCRLREILADLFARGYNGGLSIEPHIASVIHLKKDIQDPEIAYNTYVEYGRRLEKLVGEIRPAVRK